MVVKKTLVLLAVILVLVQAAGCGAKGKGSGSSSSGETGQGNTTETQQVQETAGTDKEKEKEQGQQESGQQGQQEASGQQASGQQGQQEASGQQASGQQSQQEASGQQTQQGKQEEKSDQAASSGQVKEGGTQSTAPAAQESGDTGRKDREEAGFPDGKFMLAGTAYQLPVSQEDLKAAGWTVRFEDTKNAEAFKMQPGEVINAELTLAGYEQAILVTAEFENFSKEAVLLKECPLTAIYISAKDGTAMPQTVGSSKKDEGSAGAKGTGETPEAAAEAQAAEAQETAEAQAAASPQGTAEAQEPAEAQETAQAQAAASAQGAAEAKEASAADNGAQTSAGVPVLPWLELPGGIIWGSSADDIKGAYGEPTFSGNNSTRIDCMYENGWFYLELLGTPAHGVRQMIYCVENVE